MLEVGGYVGSWLIQRNNGQRPSEDQLYGTTVYSVS